MRFSTLGQGHILRQRVWKRSSEYVCVGLRRRERAVDEREPNSHYGRWGRFTANVTVTDSAGAQATGSASVDILQPPCPLRREPLLGMPPLGETDLGFLIGGVVVLFVIGLVVYRRRIRR